LYSCLDNSSAHKDEERETDLNAAGEVVTGLAADGKLASLMMRESRVTFRTSKSEHATGDDTR
jgi:hypothetical protein